MSLIVLRGTENKYIVTLTPTQTRKQFRKEKLTSRKPSSLMGKVTTIS